MKKNTKILLAVGGLGAAIFAADKAGLFAGNAESGGSLGGSDDNSLTTDDNPFAKIDPNYQYPSETPYFYINPDGSVTPVTPTDDGSVYASDDTGAYVTDPADFGDQINNSPSPTWYDNPLLAGAAFAGGYLAVEGGIKGVKKLTQKSGAKDLIKAETKGAKTNAKDVVREKLGFKTDVVAPQEEILRAKYTTDADFAKGAKTTETAKSNLKGKAKGAGEAVGKAIIVGHVADRSFGAWNEFGSSYLEPRYNAQGEVSGATIGSTAKAVGVTGAVAATDVVSDLFGFATGLIYRPKTTSDRYAGNYGWFASEKELLEAIKDPFNALKGMTGYNEIAKALGYSDKVSSSNANTQTSSLFGGIVNPFANIQPEGFQQSSLTNPTVSASKNTSSSGSYKAYDGVTYSSSEKTITTSNSSGGSRKTYVNETGKKISSSDAKSAGSKGSNYVVITKKSGKKIIRNK